MRVVSLVPSLTEAVAVTLPCGVSNVISPPSGSRPTSRWSNATRTFGSAAAASSSALFSAPRLIELIARSPEPLYDWNSGSPSTGWIMRPRIGSASAITSSSRPMRRSASRPRSDSARLIERPRSTVPVRGAGRRS